jgi:RND family efflux transporter MFP subunit
MAEANYQMALSKRKQLDEKIRQAEQAVKGAAVMKSYSEIRAPFSGTVTRKMVEPGNLTAPGAPLLIIEKEGTYRLETHVEESRLPLIRLGQPVKVHVEALNLDIDARVSEIVPAVDAASRAFLVRIDLPRVAKLHSGLFARAEFPIEPRPVVVVPASAVRSQGQVQSIFVIEGGRARSRMVTIGDRHDDQVEVLSGLAPGEKVVYPVQAELVDGSRVEVQS